MATNDDDPDDIANKHLQLVQKPESADQQLDIRPESYDAFRIDPQLRPSNLMLDLWFKNGNQHCLAYNHLYGVELEPSIGMILTFSQHRVEVEGHHLLELYNALKRSRVVYIWEADHIEANQAADDQPVVTRLQVHNLADDN